MGLSRSSMAGNSLGVSGRRAAHARSGRRRKLSNRHVAVNGLTCRCRCCLARTWPGAKSAVFSLVACLRNFGPSPCSAWPGWACSGCGFGGGAGDGRALGAAGHGSGRRGDGGLGHDVGGDVFAPSSSPSATASGPRAYLSHPTHPPPKPRRLTPGRWVPLHCALNAVCAQTPCHGSAASAPYMAASNPSGL